MRIDKLEDVFRVGDGAFTKALNETWQELSTMSKLTDHVAAMAVIAQYVQTNNLTDEQRRQLLNLLMPDACAGEQTKAQLVKAVMGADMGIRSHNQVRRNHGQ